MTPIRLLPFALLGLLATTSLADVVYLRDGSEERGRVLGESYSEVELRKPGRSSPHTIDSSDVVRVEYGRTSADYLEAEKLEQAGDMGGAAYLFVTTAQEDDLPDFIAATALARAGAALVQNGDFARATSIFDELLRDHPNSRHLAPALLGKGTCLFYTNDLAGADSAFQRLKEEVSSKKLGERWAAEAEFFLLWSAEAQEKPGVIQGYKDLRARTRGKFQGIANKCALRMGRVHLAAAEVAEAERLFDEIIGSRLDTDTDVVAGAFNGRGQCAFGRAQGLLGAGRNEDALEYFEEARLDFLRVIVSYPGVHKEQAEALYSAGVSFLNVASLDPSDEDGESQGLRLLKRCRESYSGSEWAKRAAAEY